MKLVVVTWIDSTGSNTWQDIEQERKYKNPELFSVGWVINDTKEALTLGSSLLPNPSASMVGQTMTIPKGCIKKVRYVGSKYTLSER